MTTLSRGWPMIRFGTGDLARATASRVDGGAARISRLLGRVGAAVKAREIFIYPTHVENLASRLPGVAAARVAIGRRGDRDEITVELLSTASPSAARDAEASEAFRALTRLRPDHIRWIGMETAFTIDGLLVDRTGA